MNRIADMGETLNSIAFKIKKSEDNYLKKSHNSVFNRDKPERDVNKRINNIGRFV